MAESRPFIKQSLMLLNISGLNPCKISVIRSVISGCFVFFLCLESFLWCLFNWEGLKSIEGLTSFVSNYMVCAKMSVMFLYRKEFIMVFDKMKKFREIRKYEAELHLEIKPVFAAMVKASKIMFTTFCFCIPFYMLKPFVSPVREMPIHSYHPVDPYQFPNFELMYVYQTVALIFCVTGIYGFDGLLVSLIITLVVEFKIMKRDVVKLRIGERIEVLRDVYEIVEHHNLILECLQDISKIYSIALLKIYFCNLTCICFGLFGIIAKGIPPPIDSLIQYGLYVFFFMAQLFFYCAAGAYLTAESSSVSNTIYNTDWYVKTQPQLRRALASMIQRANQRDDLTAGKMFSLNLDSFRKVIKASLSFFTLVQALYQEQ